MSSVIRKIIGGSSEYNTGALWQAFFDTLDCPLVSVTNDGANVYINVNDDITFRISTSRSSGARSNYCYVEHEGVSFNVGFANRPIELTLCYSDTLLYMQGKRSDSYETTYRWCVVYEKFNNFSVYGYYHEDTGTSFPFMNLDDSHFIIKQIGDTNNRWDSQYHYLSKLSNISPGPNNITHTQGVLLTSRYYALQNSPNFISSSAVASNKVITFNNKSYYSVSSSILVPMD